MSFQEAFTDIAEYICSENEDLSEFLENLRIAKESEIPDNKESLRLLLVEFLIRPLIDEKEFEVLYTGETENEPISPVILFLFCLIREVRHYSSDGALINDLKFNVQLRNALGLEEGEKVFCRKTVSRFRSKIRAYKERTKIDLLEKIIASIMNQLHSLLTNISNTTVYRADSTDIDLFIKEASRQELLYSTMAKLVKCLPENLVPEEVKHYLDPRDRNQMFYHKGLKHSSPEITEALLEDMQVLLLLKDNAQVAKLKEYEMFLRLVEEQTEEKEQEKLQLKAGKEVPSNSLQTHLDPCATFRTKNGKTHKGYAASFVEALYYNQLNEVMARQIIQFQIEPNIYSDAQFMEDFLMGFEGAREVSLLTADGAYYSEKLAQLAKEKNLNLVPTALVGRKTNPFLTEFKLSEDGRSFISCPGEAKPVRESYQKSTGKVSVSFNSADCLKCPYAQSGECPVKHGKRKSLLVLSRTAINRAAMEKTMSEESFRKVSDIRNGIESTPSQLKNTYGCNKIRAYGRSSLELFCSFKFLALSISKLERSCGQNLLEALFSLLE